ncbi:hypothetical protein DP73_10770 [Desulfosporosinus sp. HMP52]|uniref:PepSY domain-containing protein n=1 Tax=Desulfosporosinus sp. HMP52 TaxID=1487923 RepID=UPI00051FE8F8|nr:PepSY domain-containing protein [Desulfosporosinus sp. HMP52]KGK89276.1 hypothetical protein DP73_10770 [Desulfosporosinus sp. HMP52]
MFRKMRNLHLWIGLITSIIILMEAVTGLMLAHPSLVGMQSRAPIAERTSQINSSGSSSIATLDQNESSINQSLNSQEEMQSELTAQKSKGLGKQGSGNGLMGVIKGLHAGKVGNLNIQWLIDLSAISMIVLTISGIYLSVKILRVQRKA